MEGKLKEKFKWKIMECDQCNRIGSTKRRKRWKQQQEIKQATDKNKNIHENTYEDTKVDEEYAVVVSENNETQLVTHILQQQKQQKQQQQQQQQHKENTLVSLLLKKYDINWRSCFCYLSWSNFRWLAFISAIMKTITLKTPQEKEQDKQRLQKQQQQHKNDNLSEVKEKKGSKRNYNNYSEFVQSSFYSSASCKKIKILKTTTTITANISPTIKETLSSPSSAIITSTIIPTTTTTITTIEKTTDTNFLNWRQKFPIFSWDRKSTTRKIVFPNIFLLLLLLLGYFDNFKHQHAVYAALIPPQQVNSSAKEALELLEHYQNRNNIIVNNNNSTHIKNVDNFVGVHKGATRDMEETLEKLDNQTLKSYSIIDGNSQTLEHLENTMMLLEGKRTSTTEPIFDFGMPRNITARTGQGEAIIKCRVEELHDKSVSWIRKRDLHILSVGTATYTSDKRFEVTGSKDQREWSLHVKAPQPRDSGIYECQINTEPKISMAFQLNIIEISPDAKAVINGPADLHFKVGSAIILNCVVQQPSIKDIGPIYWYRGEHMITPFEIDENSAASADLESFDTNANEVLEIVPPKSITNAALEDTKRQQEQTTANEITQDFTTRIAMESQLGDILKSRLRISNAQKTDTGNYTCQPTTASSASVLVHVINDENPAAMQKSAAVALHGTPDTLFCTITAVVVIEVMLVLAFVFQQNSLVTSIRATTTKSLPKTEPQLNAKKTYLVR